MLRARDKKKPLKSWNAAPFAGKIQEVIDNYSCFITQQAIDAYLEGNTSPNLFYRYMTERLIEKNEFSPAPRPVALDLGAIKKCYCEWCGETETRLLYSLPTENELYPNEQNLVLMCPICAHSLDKITDEELERDLLICLPSKQNSTSKSVIRSSSPVLTSEKT